MKCIYCGSEDVIYRKFHHIWECQDCGESFDPDERERMTEEINVFFSYAHDDEDFENGAVVVDRLNRSLRKNRRKNQNLADTYSIPRNRMARLITAALSKRSFCGFHVPKGVARPRCLQR